MSQAVAVPEFQEAPVARPGSYREVLGIAVPLVLSTSSFTVQHIVDRMFLSRYSPQALAACVPAGASSFLFIAIFMGTAGYVGTFVSQYDGAKRPHRIGAAMWQGFYFSLISTLLLVPMAFLFDGIFAAFGHPSAIVAQEAAYFRILTAGGGCMVFSFALSSFYSGRGKTWTVMWVNFAATAINIVLDYCWIFGHAGFPAMGIAGAAYATVLAQWVATGIYVVLLTQARYREQYAMLEAWRPDADLFRRLLRYGLPTGAHLMVDVLAFTLFVLLLGQLGQVELAASNVVFTINMIIFMPLVGTAMAAQILVGRYQGAHQSDDAARATWTSMKCVAVYVIVTGAMFLLTPDTFIGLFQPEGDAARFAPIAHLAHYLLYFVVGFALIDAVSVMYSAALKGAGDTRYVLITLVLVAPTVLIAPMWIGLQRLHAGIYFAWILLTLYVAALAAAYYLRYRTGCWRSMRVIEQAPPPPAVAAECPVVEA